MLYDNYMTECCIVCLKMYQRLLCEGDLTVRSLKITDNENYLT